MAQRMAQLYREAKEERAAKCTELEGVVQELKAHMEVRWLRWSVGGRGWSVGGLQQQGVGRIWGVLGGGRVACTASVPALSSQHPPLLSPHLPAKQSSRSAHQEALAREEEARRAAEQLVAEERAQRQRMLSAAASGNLPLMTAAGGLVTPGGGTFGAGAGAAGSPGMSPGGEAAAAGLSATELYSKYVEMHERYRAERLKVRQQEIVMEELCSEVEKRAALVKEQQVGGWVSGCAHGDTGRCQLGWARLWLGDRHAAALECRPALPTRRRVFQCCTMLSSHPPHLNNLTNMHQAEYERVKAAYTEMSSSLESLSAEKRRMEQQLAQMEADGRRNDRDRRSLEQQVGVLGCVCRGVVGWRGGLAPQ